MEKNRYPFCIIMFISFIAFWIMLPYSEYRFDRYGNFKKNEKVYENNVGKETVSDDNKYADNTNDEDIERVTSDVSGGSESGDKIGAETENTASNRAETDSDILGEGIEANTEAEKNNINSENQSQEKLENETEDGLEEKNESEVKGETELTSESEVKEESELASESEVKEESELASESEITADSELTEDLEIESETKSEPKESGFTQVELDYLDNALFIGDSRTLLLYEYAGWEKTDFFAEVGLTIFTVLDRKLATDTNTGDKITVREGLQQKQYDKVYIMLGINELGDPNHDVFLKYYTAVVDEIRKYQPEAIIFIQAILHVSDKKDSEGTYINNIEINARNEKIKTLVDNRTIFYIDANEVFDEEGTGKLNSEYTADGVHVKAKYVPIWENFLLSHGVVAE